MQPGSNGSVIDRIVAWLRGLFSAGKGATDLATRSARHTAHEATDTVRDGAAERKVRDIADRRRPSSTSAGDRDQHDLPDLADEPSGGGRSTFDATTSARGAASTYSTDAAFARETSDDAVDLRSDFDDAAGDEMTGDETYPPLGGDLASATHVHDAVGGEDELADDTTDGTIDTTRDADLRPGGTEGLQGRDVSLQDQLIVDEGASSDEFDGDEITPGDADNPYVTTEDVESAAEGYGDTDNTDLANTSPEGTSSLTGSTYTETDVVVPPAGAGDANQSSTHDRAASSPPEAAGRFQVVERYNYGDGDLGVGAGTTPDRAWDHDAGPDVTTADIDTGIDADINAARRDATSADSGDADADATSDVDASVSPAATRSEIESQSRGDAVNRSDEATQAPGFGDPETFANAATGTTEPSRSATGDDLDDEQDALGTTLDYTEESDAFSEEAADLSGEDELTVSDANVDFSAERVATFQSGTIAQQGGLASDDVTVDEEVTTAAYADLPDEPEPATADDAGEDDLAGSDYPSDRIVDTLDGDDFTDAETPDVPDLDSSAGDLDVVSTDPAAQVDYVSEPVERTVGDAGDRLDQDLLANTDQTVGEDISELEASASLDVDEAGAHSLTGAGTTGAADTISGATVGESAPAGSVPGDGGTEAPEGYPVKGNANSMVYHLPDFPSYAGTKAEHYFATEEDAIAAGYRAPGNVRRTGDATSRPTSGESASETPTGVVTTSDASDVSGDRSTYPPASAASEATGTVSSETGASARGDDESAADIPAGAVRGDGGTEPPAGYPVKGNASSMIYHLPSFPSYKSTKAEFYFASEEDAINAGYRAPGKRNRGRKH